MSYKPITLVMDEYGVYRVPKDSIMATAPKRRDGWWDRRTKAGRAAIEEYMRKRARRQSRYIERLLAGRAS